MAAVLDSRGPPLSCWVKLTVPKKVTLKVLRKWLAFWSAPHGSKLAPVAGITEEKFGDCEALNQNGTTLKFRKLPSFSETCSENWPFVCLLYAFSSLSLKNCLYCLVSYYKSNASSPHRCMRRKQTQVTSAHTFLGVCVCTHVCVCV